MCKKSDKTADHLQLHFEIARALWVDVFSKFKLAWFMPASIVALLASWTNNIGGTPQITVMWKMVPICILWYLWQERNDHTFKENECSFEELRSLFVRTLLFWTIAIDFNSLDFQNFFVTFSSLDRCLILYTILCTWAIPIILTQLFTYKKKNFEWPWVMHRRVVDFFTCWRSLRGNLKIAVVWNMTPLLFYYKWSMILLLL